MLLGLHIENVAAIETLDIEFENGLNILTGETGAGKSIIIDSINLAAGGRASRESIRNGCQSLLVQALFSRDGEEFLLSREVYADGRSVCRVNGALSTAAVVKELVHSLFSIHGQHDNQKLLKSENHLSIIDSFAGNEGLVSEYVESYNLMKEAESRLKRAAAGTAELERRLDMLKYQLSEIDAADLKPGEEDELSEIRLKLSNAEKIAGAVHAAKDMLYGNNGAYDLLSSASTSISGVSGFDSKLAEFLENIESAVCVVDDVSHELSRYASGIEHNPVYLAEVEERLNTIAQLKRKYGSSIEEILEYRNEIDSEIFEIENISTNFEKLEEDFANKRKLAENIAAQLTSKRVCASDEMCRKIADELAVLDMKSVVLKVMFTKTELSEIGAETAEFLIATNVGEEPKPMIKIASGGELSRIMLAIQSVLEDDTDTVIFDEIDSGVSGRAALKIADKLYEIAKNHQVICITHLAQIAVMADCHFLIEKKSDGRVVRSSVMKVSGKERLEEIARITGGAKITDVTLKNAEEMLEQAEKHKTL